MDNHVVHNGTGTILVAHSWIGPTCIFLPASDKVVQPNSSFERWSWLGEPTDFRGESRSPIRAMIRARKLAIHAQFPSFGDYQCPRIVYALHLFHLRFVPLEIPRATTMTVWHHAVPMSYCHLHLFCSATKYVVLFIECVS